MKETTITPLFSDSDALGHTNYQAIIRWLEEARSPLYRLLYPKYADGDRFFVLVHIELDFSGETLVDFDATIRTCVSEIGNTSFTMRQELLQNGNLCVRGGFVFVHFDRKTRRPIPLGAEMREKLQLWFDTQQRQ